MDFVAHCISEFNFFSGLFLNIISLVVLFKLSPEKQNKNYKYLMAIQFIAGIECSICQEGDLRLIVALTFVLILFIITYTVIIIYYKRCKHFLTEHENILTQKTLKLNKQLLLILFLQSVTPLIIVGLPTCTFLFIIAIKKVNSTDNYGILIHSLLTVTPTINSFLYLILPERNRKGIRQFFIKIWKFVCCKKNVVHIQVGIQLEMAHRGHNVIIE
uniref:G_PROTEIN_RECEP_F1_2 domain-containing protein n=1 Tax=Parastrongyloides trichosuri TaxID=131310 RepID=A0A0N4ZD37_PARTI